MTTASQNVMFNPYSQAIPQERHRRSLNLVQVHVGRWCPCNPRERLLVCLTNDVYSTSWVEVSTEQPNNHRTLARSLLQPPHPPGRKWQPSPLQWFPPPGSSQAKRYHHAKRRLACLGAAFSVLTHEQRQLVNLSHA
jgi:hypothetical protein